MLKIREHITVFEHEKLFTNKGEKTISDELHLALENYYGEYSPFFNLIRNGVQFNEFVGVIQVGNTLIEVLPKADKNGEEVWRPMLINMIRTVWGFQVRDTGSSSLKIRNNSILDLYFELFVIEVEKLLHKGLIKKYNNTQGNLFALKGRLNFAKQISNNLTHQERFFVDYTQYSVDHLLHSIIYKALKLVGQINSNINLKGRIGALLLNFPEMKDVAVSNATFEKITFDRKNFHYKKSIEIARLILLNYHPDISRGKNNVLALMFDMNLLWEQFVYVVLKRNLKNAKVISQISKNFWYAESGSRVRMKPDIVIETSHGKIVLDTKWKNMQASINPSPEDLRQMYVYHDYFEANQVALVYPGQESIVKGRYYTNKSELSEKLCSLIQIATNTDFRSWKSKISESISEFAMPSE